MIVDAAAQAAVGHEAAALQPRLTSLFVKKGLGVLDAVLFESALNKRDESLKGLGTLRSFRS